MSKCVIPSNRRRKRASPATDQPIVRIRPEHYDAIVDLAMETGRTRIDVISRLLDSALEDVEILYPDEEADC